MKLVEFSNLKEKLRGSALLQKMYHGTTTSFDKFKRPNWGVFFTPHKSWATRHYGTNIVECYIWAPKVYTVKASDDKLLDALFDRNYEILSQYIAQLQSQGYYALQTQTDSEMVCVFSNAKIYSATTGEEM